MPANALPLFPVAELQAYSISDSPCGPALASEPVPLAAPVRTPLRPGSTAAGSARPASPASPPSPAPSCRDIPACARPSARRRTPRAERTPGCRRGPSRRRRARSRQAIRNSGTRPPSGGEAVVHRVHRAAGGGGGGTANSAESGSAEAHLLAFHVAHAPDRRRAASAADCRRPRPRSSRATASTSSSRHRQEQSAALPPVADHVAERERERERDDAAIDQVSIRSVSGGRVLERMRGVGVEEAAAVGAEFLDRFLEGGRPQRDQSASAFQRVRLDIGRQVLRHAEGDQRDRRPRLPSAAAHRA